MVVINSHALSWLFQRRILYYGSDKAGYFCHVSDENECMFCHGSCERVLYHCFDRGICLSPGSDKGIMCCNCTFAI